MKRRVLYAAVVGAALLPAQEMAVLARRPYLQNVREDSAVVMWTTTGAPGVGVVRYGDAMAVSTAQEYRPETTGLPATIYQHRARLTGLRAGERVRYRVFLDGREVLPGETLEFLTAGPGAFDFLVFGDSGDGGHPQRRLAEQMFREQPALVLHTGDIAYYEGTWQAFEQYYFGIYGPLMRRTPFFPAPGNHDYVFEEGAPFVAVHDFPVAGVPVAGRGRYYSFDWSNVHFVSVDSNTPLREAMDGSGELLRWLDADLAATRLPFRVVYFHHTVFPTANYVGNAYCERANEALTGLLERHGVQLVLMGHEHLYQRTKPHRHGQWRTSAAGTVYVTTGGAGSNLYPPGESAALLAGTGDAHYLRARVDGRLMTVEAIGVEGNVLDRFTLSAGPIPEGVTDAAAGRPALAPGGLASLYGWTLAPGLAAAARYPLPRELTGVSVKVGGLPAPLLFVSRNQINFQLPYAVPSGETTVTVAHAGATATLPATVRAMAPAMFQAAGRAAVTHADGTLVSSASPARAGEWMTVYLTGLGAVEGAVTEGEAAPAARLAQAIRVELDSAACDVAYAGLAPGLAGVNQINWRVPPGVKAGISTLRVGEAAAAVPVRE